jgi:hypothetical protein
MAPSSFPLEAGPAPFPPTARCGHRSARKSVYKGLGRAGSEAKPKGSCEVAGELESVWDEPTLDERCRLLYSVFLWRMQGAGHNGKVPIQLALVALGPRLS